MLTLEILVEYFLEDDLVVLVDPPQRVLRALDLDQDDVVALGLTIK